MKFVKIFFKFIVDAGYQATRLHKLSHWFYKHNLKHFSLLISRFNRLLTGIEIEGGAILSDSVIISHGTGIVIGNEAIIGDNVLIRQNVTIGRSGKESKKEKLRMHPIIKNNVQIGAGAVIIGDIIVNENVIIGANAVVTKNVPSNTVIVGVPGEILRINKN